MKPQKTFCLVALLFSLSARAEYTIILTNCQFTSDTPEQKALEYVQIQRTYLSAVGSDDPQDQIVYRGLIFRRTNGTNIQISKVDVERTPGIPIIPKKTVRFQDDAEFNLAIDLKTLKGTFAYKNSVATQPVQCSVSGDGKYW